MSYGPNVQGFHLRAAVVVDNMLKGARAGDLPLSTPTQFRQAINLRAAEQLGLAILASANEVIR